MNMQNHELVTLVLTRLSGQYPKPPVPVEAIEREIHRFRELGWYEDLVDADWELLARIIKSRVRVTMEPGETLAASTVTDWIGDRRDQIDWKRWVSYKQHLAEKGFTPGVISSLDESTREIVNCLGDPSIEGVWKRRGLVIGEVQSGKTATYLGAVNKAVDAGYKLIILLAGGTEALRKQTQHRVDEGLIGRDTSAANQVVGVGKWHGNFVSAQAMTTQASDFRKTSKQATSIVVDPNSPTPLVFVLKKNKTALENVRDWIMNQRVGEALIDIPMLLVDDESDYASVNTKNLGAKDQDPPTVINALIRDILGQVTRSSYLAFTATPFANVFIDHETESETLGDDLFPSDYIRTLDAPSNYVGSSAYFGSDEATDSSLLVSLDDAEDFFPFNHKSHLSVDGLPASLIDAVRCFVVASAIREERGDNSPRAMLVNVSRFKLVQAQVHALVQHHFERIRSAVELHSHGFDTGDGEHAEIAALRKLFEERYSSSGVSWDQVCSQLGAAVDGVSVRLINSDRVKNVDDLSDLESDRMIAVGGDVLSRGLTLEGLTVSYFHRKVGASDTLLQMARWFGYRPGYSDLCRVWIPEEVADQFRYVASIVDDLRGQLRAMKKQGLAPRDFGLAVRMHPESLLITARNKMRAAEAKAWTINVAGAKNLETARIDSDASVLEKNRDALETFVRNLAALDEGTQWSVPGLDMPGMEGVPKELVADFLGQYVGFVNDPFFAESALATFVRNTSTPRLQNWLVAFVPGSGDPVELAGLKIPNAPRRSVVVGSAVEVTGRKAIPFRVSGRSVRLAGSTDVGKVARLEGPALKEPAVYETLPYPVLLIYVLEPIVDAKEESTADAWEAAKVEGVQHLIGVKVGIPGKPGDKGAEVRYMLNSVAVNAWAGTALEETVEDLDELDGADDE